MGSCGKRFGRNVPLEHTFPGHRESDDAEPARRQPRADDEATSFSRPPSSICMAASWIQFMVHDWFVHKRSETAFVEIPLGPGDDWSDSTMKVPRSVPEPAPAGSTRPPAYANPNGHWWDGSQIYGSDPEVAAKLRTGEGGKLKVEATKLLPVDPTPACT